MLGRVLLGTIAAGALGLGGAAAILALVETGRLEASRMDLERVAAALGFEIRNVSITGHRFTTDREIYRALDLDAAATQMSFDPGAARARIEALPWVRTATIARALPDGIVITIRERHPAAVWRDGGRDVLIDDTGRELGAVTVGSDTGLPLVVGEGAASGAAEILALVTAQPELARRMAAVHRVADRRWSIELASGTRIELPADAAAPALTRLAGILARPGATVLLDGALQSIDLRLTGEITVRRAGASGVARGLHTEDQIAAVLTALSQRGARGLERVHEAR